MMHGPTYLLCGQAPGVLEPVPVVLPPLRGGPLGEPVGVEKGGYYLLLVRWVLQLSDEEGHTRRARDAVLSLVHAGQQEARHVPDLIVPLFLVVHLEEERTLLEGRFLILLLLRFLTRLLRAAPRPCPVSLLSPPSLLIPVSFQPTITNVSVALLTPDVDLWTFVYPTQRAVGLVQSVVGISVACRIEVADGLVSGLVYPGWCGGPPCVNRVVVVAVCGFDSKDSMVGEETGWGLYWGGWRHEEGEGWWSGYKMPLAAF